MKRIVVLCVCCFCLCAIPVTLSAFVHGPSLSGEGTSASGRLIVKIDGNATTAISHDKSHAVAVGIADFDTVNRKYGIRRQEYLYPAKATAYHPEALRNVFVVEVPSGVNADDLKNAYLKLPDVVYVEFDAVAELYDTPNDPYFAQQWGLHNTGQEHYHVFRYEDCGNDVPGVDTGTVDVDIDAWEVYNNPPDQTVTTVVAIIDTGVDMDHPDLNGRIWSNPAEISGNGVDDDHNGYIDDVHGWDFCSTDEVYDFGEDNDPTDEYGHGTHCAGIVAAVGDNNLGIAGVVDDCRIMPLKFSPVMLSSLAARAIVYAADNGADVISMSWGYPWQVQVLDDALAYARTRGMILVAASGNDGEEVANYPAASPGVITVAAGNSDGYITSFSTFDNHVNITAPGQSILSLRADATDMYAPCEEGVHVIGDQYILASGTSMACPYVAGIAAYLRAESPGLVPDVLENILYTTAVDVVDPYDTGGDYPGWDKYSGFGWANLHDALAVVPEKRAKIIAPLSNAIVCGTVTVTGTADGADFSSYTLEYGEGATPTTWTPIATSGTPVTDGILGQWHTGSRNGRYSIRLRVGTENVARVTVSVCNGTIVEITNPHEDAIVVSSTEILGTACAPNFVGYDVESAPLSDPDDWTTLVESSIPVFSDKMHVWNTGVLDDGQYLLRLSLYSSSGLEKADTVQVSVQSIFSTGNAWKLHFDTSVAVTANYGDFNGDGINEVVVGTEDSLYFVAVDGTPLIDEWRSVPAYDFRIPVAVGNLDGDAIEDLVAIGAWGGAPHATLFGFRSADTNYAINLPMGPIFESLDGGSTKYYPRLLLEDIDNDGLDEIIYYTGARASTQAHWFVYNPDGTFAHQIAEPSLLFPGCQYADLDGDNIDELYTASDYQLYRCTQSGLFLSAYQWPGLESGAFKCENISAIDIDADSKQELIVLGSYDNSIGDFWIFAFDENLTLKPGWPHNTGIDNYVLASSPIFADIDTDGSLEYFITMWELAYSQVYAWHIDGAAYTGDSSTAIFATSPNPAKIHAPVLSDMNDDGLPDVVVCLGPDIFYTYNVERILAWDINGDVLSGWPMVVNPDIVQPGNFSWHSPVIGDINKDGYVDMVVTTIMNDLVFLNFEGMHYRPGACPVPTWRYNRRMNNIGPVRSAGMVCGDADSDGYVNLLDILFLISFLYGNPPGPTPDPVAAGDANADGAINLLDVLHLVNFLYNSPPGPEPICP
ncbi:MAG: S8 family serine peptidase [candidate division Zixibacteria bacterium]|nr:S8 family serine peptidase [candidate division Zixibacteria bacterium]